VAIAEARVVLAAFLDTFAEEAEARVQHHIAARLNPEGKRWLEEGIGYLSDQSECPFCGLDTTLSSLVDDYRVVFSDLYRQHGVRITTTKRQLSEALAEANLVAIEGVIASNGARCVFWKGHGIDAPSADHLGDLRKVWLKAVSTIGALFAKKDADVLAPVLPTDDQRADLDAVLSMLERLREYNAQVAEIDKKIVALKQQAGEVNLKDVAGQLALLKLMKERYEPTVDAMCKDLISLRAKKKEAESAKQTAKKALDDATEHLFSKYQATLNKHLTNCGCGYSITGTKTSYSGGKPRTEYQLLLNEKPIDLVQPKAKPHDPCFRNTLSDGDRSTLAFALFIARLELDHDLGSKIVVLDDPMTSLDAHRRAYTCEQIADIAGKARQVIVLTHDATFAVDVWGRLIKPKRALRLGVSGVDTVIDEEWDISAATQSEYFCRCRLLTDCVTGVHGLNQLAVASTMRPVVEANLRMRFPGAFAPDMWLGDLIKQIKEAPAADMLAGMQPRLNELIAINEYSKKYHHDYGSPSKSQPTLVELQSYSRRTLEFIAGV
jgi:wobble nucleotide-excising tRNase